MKSIKQKSGSSDFIKLCNLFLARHKLFDAESCTLQEQTLHQLLIEDFNHEKLVIQLHNALLFTIAYPANAGTLTLTNQLMQKLVQEVTKQVKMNPDLYYNSGITGSVVCARFGLLLNQYLLSKNLSLLELSSIEGEHTDLVSQLTFTLDPVEQELMPDYASYFKKWQKIYLGKPLLSKHELLNYYINASMQIVGNISQKEAIFEGFELYTRFCLEPVLQGISSARQSQGKSHFHPEGIRKKVAIETVLSQGKPKSVFLKQKQKEILVNIARGTMASLLRETDTFTFAQTHETELFDMGEGITIALYYMIPEQKFSLQSYVGFLLFKNGVPMAYGGCWLFANQAAFGVNVLPPYRGGESANVVCQLLRLYYHRFKILQFTVDPYQIGKGNEEGISSGAFWFYYKLGFRPLQKQYSELAQTEVQKKALDKNYKTPRKILMGLANSELYLKMTDREVSYYPLLKVSECISKYVNDNYSGNRKTALEYSLSMYQKLTKTRLTSDSFLNNLLLTLDTLGAFEKLPANILKKICDAYAHKSENEAKTFLDLNKMSSYFKLFPNY